MKSGEVICDFRASVSWHQKIPMSFENVLVTVICLLHIITFYKRFNLYIRTHTKITIIIFFWNFWIEPETKNLFFCFYLLVKFITFIPAIITKPLFAQNVLELALILSIVFIADFFFLAPCWKVSEYCSQAILY